MISRCKFIEFDRKLMNYKPFLSEGDNDSGVDETTQEKV